MTNDQFLKECKFIANYVLRFHHDDLEKSIDRAMSQLKGKRAEMMPKDNPLRDDIFKHYCDQYRPLVRAMVYACDNKKEFKK
jgi:hypothetical protein